jgi:hypothetical protein
MPISLQNLAAAAAPATLVIARTQKTKEIIPQDDSGRMRLAEPNC